MNLAQTMTNSILLVHIIPRAAVPKPRSFLRASSSVDTGNSVRNGKTLVNDIALARALLRAVRLVFRIRQHDLQRVPRLGPRRAQSAPQKPAGTHEAGQGKYYVQVLTL